ncbi:DegT/DnrJ/EryC1/StrS family aminotransferase [Gracilinema caldarium]|uniref:DegT/DnrJ/EryC1/StrS family aminotransferase n=1 Tax=Gracilinema caldarium TaxID=215591 RepID=UPI0026E9F42C|nr:DegT/DnrJ/EryC1/StrS family aminotransferase [Gracilinema caldarium]
MKIEVFSPTIRRKEMDAVLSALVDDALGPGELSLKLLAVAKEYINFEYGVSFRSPTFALFYALKALNIANNEGVLISALSPYYYIQVLKDASLTPIIADVDEHSGNLTKATISKALQEASVPVRCIINHHTLGYVPNTADLTEFGIPIIEDISRSYGTNTGELKAGALGTLTLLGLEERDVLTAGGGAILYANSRREAAVLKQFAELPPEYQLPDMNAAMAIVQFKEHEKNFARRKEIAEVLLQASLRTRHKRFLQLDIAEYNNYSFPLILQTGMKDVVAYGNKKEVAVETAFNDTIIVKLPEYQSSCPTAYSLSLRTVLFPLYPRLSGKQIEKIAKVLATLP